MKKWSIDENTFRDWITEQPFGTYFHRWECNTCPLAEFIKSILKTNVNLPVPVEVGSDGYVTIDGIIYELPGWTVAFVRKFDGPFAGYPGLGTKADALEALNAAL